MNMSAFLSYVLLSTLTPGPNNIMAMSSSSKHGFKKAFLFCVGVFFGFVAVCSCAAAGAMLLSEFMPKVENVMRWIGAGYILWLAWSIKGAKPKGEAEPSSRAGSFVTGVTLQFVNVKGILFALTVMSAFILPHYQSAAILASAVLFLSCMCFISTCCWALFGVVFEKFFHRHGGALHNIMALLLVYCAASLFF
jgi:threonine/homoserine/homoserine lactone efflux protein